jgi:hypothetical protein
MSLMLIFILIFLINFFPRMFFPPKIILINILYFILQFG